VAAADKAFGGVDVLVNKRRPGYLSRLRKVTTLRSESCSMSTTYGAVDMIKAGCRAGVLGSGHIVNISSMTGLVATRPTLHSSTKFALEAVTEALATEVRPLGVKVIAIERAPSAPTGRRGR